MFISTHNIISQDSLIKNHLATLVTNIDIEDINTYELDKFWTNWCDVYNDYSYYLQILQMKNKLQVIDMDPPLVQSIRMDKKSGKYLGLEYSNWLKNIEKLKFSLADLSMSNYLGSLPEFEEDHLDFDEIDEFDVETDKAHYYDDSNNKRKLSALDITATDEDSVDTFTNFKFAQPDKLSRAILITVLYIKLFIFYYFLIYYF